MGLAQQLHKSLRLVLQWLFMLDSKAALSFMQVGPTHRTIQGLLAQAAGKGRGFSQTILCQQLGNFWRTLYGNAVTSVAQPVKVNPPTGTTLVGATNITFRIKHSDSRPSH